MASSPLSNVMNRDASDYLWGVDPSGQFMYGYSWDHCSGRPLNIYDMHGSGQCLDSQGNPSGEFKFYAMEFVQTARVPVNKTPMRLAGAGYDIFGLGFGLVPASGHTVFRDGVPVINWNNIDPSVNNFPTSGFRTGPIDIRYDTFREVWTCPYNTFVARILGVAPPGMAYKLDGATLVSTLPVSNYYSIESGLYRYIARPYNVTQDEILANYPTFPLLNVAELNNDYPYLDNATFGLTTVMVMRNPSPLASGSFLCNERPLSFSAFI